MSQVSAVLAALYAGKTDEAKFLASKQASLDVFEAAALGRVDRLLELLDEHAPRAKSFSTDGFSALHLAAFFDQLEAARLLIARGADVNLVSRNPMKVQPLHSAAAVGSRALVELLLEAGAAPNAKQAGGFTALHARALHGDLDLVVLLLAKGADPSVRADDGRSAEGMARDKGHKDLVRLLSKK